MTILKILTIGEPTQNGRIYNKEVCEKIVEDFKKRKTSLLGEMNNFPSAASLLSGQDDFVINLENVTHEVKDIFIEGNDLNCDLQPINNEVGSVLSEMLKDGTLVPQLRGFGHIDENWVISNYELLTIDVGYSDITNPLDNFINKQSIDEFVPVKVDNYDDYIKGVERTCSSLTEIKANETLYYQSMNMFIASGNILDKIKKNVAYGKIIDYNDVRAQMTCIEFCMSAISNEWDSLDEKTSIDIDPDTCHAVLGIATEASELVTVLKDKDYNKMFDENGDINWYQGLLVKARGWKFWDVLSANLTKLKKRFPDKFDSNLAINKSTTEEFQEVGKHFEDYKE